MQPRIVRMEVCSRFRLLKKYDVSCQISEIMLRKLGGGYILSNLGDPKKTVYRNSFHIQSLDMNLLYQEIVISPTNDKVCYQYSS